MYATPIIYPLSRIPQRWHALVALNPMTMPVGSVSATCSLVHTPDATLLAISVAVTILILIGGLLVFQRVEKTFVDVA